MGLPFYDTTRRIEELLEGFLAGDRLRGKAVLEVGAGLGFFGEQMRNQGARVTASDIGERLLEAVSGRIGCRCECVDALSLQHFGPERFDVILSSECIEHRPSPERAAREMAGVPREKGLHLYPFQLGLHFASRWCDDRLRSLRGMMIHLCVLGRKARRPVVS